MLERSLEQLFLRPRGGRIEVLLVLLSVGGAPLRERLTLPTREPQQAVTLVARHLLRRGDVADVRGVRVRLERGGRLHDEPKLARRLQAVFERERELDA